MLTIKYQSAFKKDYKRIVKRGYDIRLLEEVISILANRNLCRKNLEIIVCWESIQDAENVILLRTGC